MVVKGGKSPGSRGNSPLREENRKNPSSRSNKVEHASSPKRRLCNGTSPDKTRLRSRGNSPASKISENGVAQPPSSRGSDAGSIERLDENNQSQRIISSYNQPEDNINVVVRVRPLSQREIKAGETFSIQFPGSGQIVVDGIPNGGSAQKSKLFSYNVVFEPAATQEDVLQFSGVKRLIEMAVEGFRCTAFCYGQTGSGKTHTLTGPPKLFDKKPTPYSDLHGLVFRSFLYLFKLLEGKPDMHFVLKASFLEIYNEKVIDLLNPGTARKPLAVRWSKKARGFFVENLFTVDCEELDDLTAVLEEGMRNRSVGSHNMNEYSSRSHTILTVHITSEQPTEGGVFISRSGKINFVDLAGSEMTKKTQSEGKTLEEANNINKSLMVLGYCIASLSDNKRKTSHIPYRDSQLTKLLADSLAGNGVTLMIACISPARSNLTETINTLRYAARAKKIRTKPIVLMDPREALILSLKREVDVLQSENEHLRSALHLQVVPADLIPEKRIIATPPQVDLEKLAELEGPQLVELVRLYVTENEALRKENTELFISRELLLRDQELVCRENERLLKKLEDVNSVCCRSPIIPAKPGLSSDILNKSSTDLDLSSSTNIWTNPIQNSQYTNRSVLPEVIQKELSKRRIGNSSYDPTHRRHNSLEDLRSASSNAFRIRSSESVNENHLMQNQPSRIRPATGRRFSMAKSPVTRFGIVTTPVLPDRLEFSGRSKSNHPEVNSPVSLSDSMTSGSPSDWNLNSTNVRKGQSPLLERRHSKQDNELKKGFDSSNSEVFGSAISLENE